ncbi:MAG: ArsR/SmtB family transcription factor [Burkholderiales bacterium]|jgi:DNA-binding transcriptional ArsR family regulator
MPYQSATTFRAISDPTRRAILDRLREDSRTVGALAEGFEVSRPAISQHLKVLLEAGLVRERKQGRQRFYSLHAQPLRAVNAWLQSYRSTWERNLLGLKEYVEAEERAERSRTRKRKSEEEQS